jgi:hypothetical protein
MEVRNAVDRIRSNRIEQGIPQCVLAREAKMSNTRLCLGERQHIELKNHEIQALETALQRIISERILRLQRAL